MRRMSYGIWGSLCLVLLISSCDDNEQQNVSLEELIEEVAFAENIFSDVDYEVDEATAFVFILSGRFGFGLGGCGTRTVEEPEDEEYPIVITIDYGEKECDSFRGVSKMGKIIITITGDRETEGAQRIVTFEDYYVNGNQIEGTRTFTNDGRNDNGNLSYTVVLEGGKITTNEGDVITRNAIKTREWTAGEDTDTLEDDEFSITGTVDGTIDEEIYARIISNPLLVSRDCRWVKSGSIVAQLGDEPIVTIDFGDGECDDIATREQDGEVEEFTMEFRPRRGFRRG